MRTVTICPKLYCIYSDILYWCRQSFCTEGYCKFQRSKQPVWELMLESSLLYMWDRILLSGVVSSMSCARCRLASAYPTFCGIQGYKSLELLPSLYHPVPQHHQPICCRVGKFRGSWSNNHIVKNRNTLAWFITADYSKYI